MLTDQSVDHEAVITDIARPSTVKERYVGRAQHRHPQQMIRVDYEDRRSISEPIRQQMMNVIQSHLKKTDIVLISDYDKGVCTPGLLGAIISAANAKNIKVVADPIRGHDYRKYHGCAALRRIGSKPGWRRAASSTT